MIIINWILSIYLAFLPPLKNSDIVRFGLFTDCQYCDCQTTGTRFYRNSLSKLSECLDTFSKSGNLAFITGLGDLIDHDMKSYDHLDSFFMGRVKAIHHVTGNHDFGVDAGERGKVAARLGLKKTYYEFSKGNWRFVFLDGNDISLNSDNPEVVKTANDTFNSLKAGGKPNAHEWNGAMGPDQLKWLEKVLVKADRQKQNVLLFCHYPLIPYEDHALWNSDQVIELLMKHPSVKAWFNGHNHAGNYAEKNGIHFVNFKGMVETRDRNAFALVTLKPDRIEIKGFGREVSRELFLSRH